MKALHEWMGLVLTVAGALHVVLNWRAFWAYFAQRRALVTLVATLVLSAGLLAAGAAAPERSKGARPPPSALTEAGLSK